MSYEMPKYSRVKIKVLAASKSTYWYVSLVGKTIEVEKQIWDDGSVSYKSLKEEASYFFGEDIEEIGER